MTEPLKEGGAEAPAWLTRTALVALVGYFLAVGFWGLDFGYHWDEGYHVRGVDHCIDTLTWLPQAYNYNGVYTLVGLPFVLLKGAALLPHALHAIASGEGSQLQPSASNPMILEAQQMLRDYVESDAYLLKVRGLCLVLSSLAIPWAYLAARTLLPGRGLFALWAAGFVALSWEFGYHARFVAVDAMLTQFVTLELWLFACAWHAKVPVRAYRWALGAAAAAACAGSCKSTAIFAVLPLILLVLRPGLDWRGRLQSGASMIGVYLVVMFALSPGIFIDPIRFLGAMARERVNYSELLSNFPYFTRNFWDHASRAVIWLLMVVPSPFHVVAFIFATLIVVGCVDRLRVDNAMRAWTVYALIFFAFVAHYHLLMVRHHLVALPWLAVMFAAGVRRLAQWPKIWFRRALAAVLAIGFALNAVWGARAAASIRSDTPGSVLADFQRDIVRAHAPFRLSRDLAEALSPLLAEHDLCSAIDVLRDDAKAPRVVYLFYDHELFWKGHVNNGLDELAAFYGPMAANYDWNITFVGKMERKRIVGVTPTQAAAMELKMDDYRDCAPKR
jgi:hypothetical protein